MNSMERAQVEVPPIGGLVRCDEPRGSTVIERRAARVLLFRSTGHLSEALALFSLRVSDAVLGDVQATVAGFYDWGELRSYDAKARELSTRWMLAHRHRFDTVRLLVRSPIVAMAVQVANLAFKSSLSATTDPEEFARDVARAASAQRG